MAEEATSVSELPAEELPVEELPAEELPAEGAEDEQENPTSPVQAPSTQLPLERPLVKFDVDAVSHNVTLDDEPLLRTLLKIRQEFKEKTTRGLLEVQAEIDLQVGDARRELSTSIAETAMSLEKRFASRINFSEIMEAAETATNRCNVMEGELRKLSTKVNSLALNELTTQSQLPPATGTQVLAASTASVPALTEDEPLPGEVASASESIASRASPAMEQPPASMPRYVSSRDDFANMSNDQADGLKANVYELSKQTYSLRDEFDSFLRNMDRFDSNVSKLSAKVQASQNRSNAVEANIQLLSDEAKQQANEFREGKADKGDIQTVKDELARLEAMVLEACMAEALELRVQDAERRISALERRAASMEASSKESRKEVESLQQVISDLGLRMDKCTGRVDQLDRKGQSHHLEKFRALEQRDALLAERLSSAKAQLSEHAKLLMGLTAKADTADVDGLKTALCSLTEDIKEKEQAVLFGARCLSCNRVFDDVQLESGVVDMRAEKQRAQVFANIQRALHTPRTDPTKPIKMLAVKVGRPGNIHGFEGRDASGLSWTADDVSLSLTPARFMASDTQRLTNMGSFGVHDADMLNLPDVNLEGERRKVTARGGGTPQTARGGGTPQTARGGGTPQRGRERSKQPLAQLVGRG